MQGLHQLFESNLPNFEDKLGVIYGGKRITFGEVNRRANRLANELLKSVGLTIENAVIAISIQPSDRLIVALLATFKLGCSYVPIDTSLPVSKIIHILKDAKPICILVDGEWRSVREACETVQSDTPVRFVADLEAGQGSQLSVKIGAVKHGLQTIACVLYTSGSTGAPKGVLLTHGAVLNRLLWQWRTFPYSDDDVCVFKTSLTFVDHVSEIFGALLQGVPIVVVPKETTRNPDSFINLLSVRSVTRLVVVPSLLRNVITTLRMSQHGVRRLRRLKLCVCSGEVLPPNLVKSFFEYLPEGCTLCNFYGSTETMGDITYEVFSSANDVATKRDESASPIGRPIDNTIIYLLDDNHRPVEIGETGEMFASGGNLAAGYVGGRAANDKKFLENHLCDNPAYSRLFKTGDFARIENSSLIYEGRLDSQVKIRGHKVNLLQVQATAEKVDGVGKAVALCIECGEGKQKVVLFFTAEVRTSCSETVVRKYLLQNLPEYMLPVVVQVTKFPLLTNGKIDGLELQNVFRARNTTCERGDGSEERNPSTAVESSLTDAQKLLRRAVSTVLCLRSSDIDMNLSFFEIGGDSTSAIQTMFNLNEAGFHIDTSQFLAASSLNEVAHSLRTSCSQGLGPASLKAPTNEVRSKYKVVPLGEMEQHDELLNMLSDSFAIKEILTYVTGVTPDEFLWFIGSFWKQCVAAGYSFAIVDAHDRPVAGVVNFSFDDVPEMYYAPASEASLDVLEKAEAAAKEKLKEKRPENGKILYNFILGTDIALSYEDNVQLTILMEEENLRVARKMECVGSFTTNTHIMTKVRNINKLHRSGT